MPHTTLVLASGGSQLSGITTDATHVYWTDIGDGSVHRVAKSGGDPVTLAEAQEKPLRLAVDDTHVYWSNNLGGAIVRTAKDGSGSPTVVTAAVSPQEFIVDRNHVYFPDVAGIMRAPKVGGAATLFAPLGYEYVGQELVADTDALYVLAVTNYNARSQGVLRISFADAARTILRSQILNEASHLAVDPKFYYISSGLASAGISWCDKETGLTCDGMDTLSEGRLGLYVHSRTLAGSACGVFWAGAGGPIYLGRGVFAPPTPIVRADPLKLVADAGFLFWLDASGYIGKVAAP